MTDTADTPRSARVATTLAGINDDLCGVAAQLPHLARGDAALVHDHLVEIEHTIDGLRSRLDWLWWRSTARIPGNGGARA